MSPAPAVSLALEPDWFPDWAGQLCAIVASGPSVKREGLDKLRGRFRVIAIKECAISLVPWADVAYGCDAAWWVHRKGLPEFKGLKVAWEPSVAARFPDVHLVRIREATKSKPGDRQYLDRIITGQPGVIGAGRSSGFQALNLAIQFGCKHIALIGFDLIGSHYYGRNEWNRARNPNEDEFERWRAIYADNAPVLKSLGVEVVNLSPHRRITGYRNSNLDQIISEWCA